MSTVYYYQVIFDILDNPVAIMQNLQFGVGVGSVNFNSNLFH